MTQKVERDAKPIVRAAFHIFARRLTPHPVFHRQQARQANIIFLAESYYDFLAAPRDRLYFTIDLPASFCFPEVDK